MGTIESDMVSVYCSWTSRNIT